MMTRFYKQVTIHYQYEYLQRTKLRLCQGGPYAYVVRVVKSQESSSEYAAVFKDWIGVELLLMHMACVLEDKLLMLVTE